MENEIKLINNVDGSVISDHMLGTFSKKVDDVSRAERRIGQLEGELRVANQLIDQHIEESDRMLDEERENVTVILETTNASVVYDPWGQAMKHPSEIKYVKTERTKLNELADAVVKSQALKDVEEANKKAIDAKDKMDIMERTCKRNEDRAQKQVDESVKTRKDAIEKAVEQAERQNIRKISSLELNVKVLEKEADLLLDEQNNLIAERDFGFEAKQVEVRLLTNRIAILERSTKTILASITDRMQSWFYSRKLTRLSS